MGATTRYKIKNQKITEELGTKPFSDCFVQLSSKNWQFKTIKIAVTLSWTQENKEILRQIGENTIAKLQEEKPSSRQCAQIKECEAHLCVDKKIMN